MEDLDLLLTLIQVPTGDAATARLRDQYTGALLGCGEEAERRVASLVQSGTATNMPALMTLLAGFESERAAQILGQALQAGPNTISEAAADALASYPTTFAVEALYEGVRNGRLGIAVPALVALRRLDRRVPCDMLLPLLRSPHRLLRFHAVHLAGASACLGEQLAHELLGNETDAEIRGVLSTLRSGGMGNE